MLPSRTFPSILTGSAAIRINIIRAHWSVLFHHWWMLSFVQVSRCAEDPGLGDSRSPLDNHI